MSKVTGAMTMTDKERIAEIRGWLKSEADRNGQMQGDKTHPCRRRKTFRLRNHMLRAALDLISEQQEQLDKADIKIETDQITMQNFLRQIKELEAQTALAEVQRKEAEQLIGELRYQMEQKRETWDGHKVCELLRKDLAEAVEQLEQARGFATSHIYIDESDQSVWVKVRRSVYLEAITGSKDND
jgi:signal recognition particle GTPase